ncbi:MAG: ferredoxin, partial [Verrucomicrobia bacterium RIFCSPLOWO2_12_FULL_64_8]
MPVQITIDGRSGIFDQGVSLFDAAERLGRRPHSSCGKNGRCRECLLEVRGGNGLLTPKTAAEAHLSGDFRLSCRAQLAGADGAVVLKSPSRGVMRILDAGEGLPQTAASTPLDPAVVRAGRRILLEGTEVAAGTGAVYGAAADVGTTTVVVRIYDLETKALVAGTAFENPQRFAGSDVMARIAFDTRYGGRLLQRVLINSMTRALKELPIDTTCIYEMVVVGNSTMRDLFFGLDVEAIGQKPYRSLTETAVREGRAASTGVATTAAKLRLPFHPAARICGLPLIGSHVGADAAACLLALDMDRRPDLVALMDIGTNTEVACGNRDQLFVASCPAGPAFEGGAIQCGMPGWDGAIERVKLNGGDRPEFSVIGGGEPEGLCGSGLVD